MDVNIGEIVQFWLCFLAPLAFMKLTRTYSRLSVTQKHSSSLQFTNPYKTILYYSAFTLTWIMSFLQTLNFHCFRWLKEKNSTWKSLTIIQVRVNALYSNALYSNSPKLKLPITRTNLRPHSSYRGGTISGTIPKPQFYLRLIMSHSFKRKKCHHFESHHKKGSH